MLNKLLSQTLPYVEIAELRPIVLEVLRRHPAIPPEYLSYIGSNTQLLEACGIDVKRQLWQSKPALFLQSISAPVQSYMDQWRSSMQDQNLESASKISLRTRRSTKDLKDLVGYIGEEIKLYNLVLQQVRDGFASDANPAYCSLRVDLLLALHHDAAGKSDAKKKGAASAFGARAKVQPSKGSISRRDPCFRFIRGLAGCTIERLVDEARAKDLYNTLTVAGEGAGDLAVLGDLGMVMMDPPVYNMLVQGCYAALSKCVADRTLPSDSSHLRYLTHLLVTATLARERIKTQEFEEDHSTHLMTTVYPTLAKLQIEDMLVALDPTATRSTEPQKKLFQATQELPFVGSLVMLYALDKVAGEQVDLPGLARALPMLADTVSGKWHQIPADGSARFQEEFAASVVAHCTSPAGCKIMAKLDETAVCLLQTFFVPRSSFSVKNHVTLLAMLFALLEEDPEKNAITISGVVMMACDIGMCPDPDNLASGAGVQLRKLYQKLSKSQLENTRAGNAIRGKLGLLAPKARVASVVQPAPDPTALAFDDDDDFEDDFAEEEPSNKPSTPPPQDALADNASDWD